MGISNWNLDRRDEKEAEAKDKAEDSMGCNSIQILFVFSTFLY